MAKLSVADANFLEKQCIPLSATFDASGMSTREWKAVMKAEGKFVAYGVNCLRGHSLKTRAGNCIRCNTANIAFARRSESEGFVYLARSAMLRLVKVGFSAEDPDNRIYIANLQGYAGSNDWKIRFSVYVENAGRLEIAIHSTLKNHQALQLWERNGFESEAREVYACSLAYAKQVLMSQLAPSDIATLTTW